MPIEVVMPKFGLTMQEGTIQQWFKTEGEAIEAGQPLFEVETEKVLYEVEAPATGTVAKLLYPIEAIVPCAQVVAVIAISGEVPAEVAARYAAPAGVASIGAPEKTAGTTPLPAAARGPVVATPAARKLAKDRGIDLATLIGSGPGGRIAREDVEAALATVPAAVSAHAPLPLRGARKTIAERMFRSLQTTAQLTITTEVDVTALVAHRAHLQATFALTYTDLLVAAVAAALRRHARLRVTVDGDTIVPAEAINIGVAVALDDGLIVPVIRDADRKSLQAIADESRHLTARARAGTLGLEDVTGGTFTITNLGTFGIDAFTPIINLPQVAILGVGRIQQKPAVFEDQIAIRELLTLSLTFDHRIIDGVPAADFLNDLAGSLREPT